MTMTSTIPAGKTRTRKPNATLTDPKILVPAIGASFRKIDPRVMMRNPVMFVVEVVATLTTILFIRDPDGILVELVHRPRSIFR